MQAYHLGLHGANYNNVKRFNSTENSSKLAYMKISVIFLGLFRVSQLNIARTCQLLAHNQNFQVAIYKASSACTDVGWVSNHPFVGY